MQFLPATVCVNKLGQDVAQMNEAASCTGPSYILPRQWPHCDD